jgi:uncharacterized protein
VQSTLRLGARSKVSAARESAGLIARTTGQEQKSSRSKIRYKARPMKSFVDPLLRTDQTACVLTNTRNNRIVARTLLTAFDSASRRRGLLEHESLDEGTALIMAPSNAIHTFSMRFAIDVAFLSRDGQVVKVRPTVVPWRIAAAWSAFAVVELCGGTLAKSDTRTGDRLELIPVGRSLAACIPLGWPASENLPDSGGSLRC